MSDWNAEPATSQTWVNYTAAVKAHDASAAKMDFTGDTNIPTGSIRWNRSTLQFEEWSGAAWVALTNLVKLNAANVYTQTQTVRGDPTFGYVTLRSGDTTHPGYFEFFTADNVRKGYLGFGSGTNLLLGTDTWPWQFTAVPNVAGVNIATVANLLGLNALSDPNVDRLLFWDDSAGVLSWLQPTAGIQVVGTVLSVDQAALGTASVVASSLVKRDGAGDIFARYYNAASPDNENPSISQIFCSNGADGYLRKSSAANFLAALGIWTASTLPASTLVHTSGPETIAGVKTFSSKPLMSGEGVFLSYKGSGETSGKITVSTADPSGTPGEGDLWIKYTP